MPLMLQRSGRTHGGAAENNDYGRPGVMLQYFFDMEMLIEVPPESFGSRTEGDSACGAHDSGETPHRQSGRF